MNGNEEAVAALLSPWGKTLLSARGVRDPERVQADARKVAVASALKRGDTPAARALGDHFGNLGVVKGTAGDVVRRLAGHNHR